MQFNSLKELVNAVICATRNTKHDGVAFAANATEEEIIGSIKEFLRQSIGRAKTWELQHQNERNLHHRDMYEIEEVSSAVNETDNEQSETSTNLENDNDDSVSDETNKNRSFDTLNSSDDE